MLDAQAMVLGLSGKEACQNRLSWLAAAKKANMACEDDHGEYTGPYYSNPLGLELAVQHRFDSQSPTSF